MGLAWSMCSIRSGLLVPIKKCSRYYVCAKWATVSAPIFHLDQHLSAILKAITTFAIKFQIQPKKLISKHWGGGIAGIHLPSMPFTDTPPPSKNPTACISNQHCTYIFVITPHWIKLWLQQCNAMKQTHWMCFHKCSNLPRSIVASTCNVLWGKSIVTISCLLLIFFWLSAQPCSHDVHTQTKTTQTQ